jgi:hypothetical protein
MLPVYLGPVTNTDQDDLIRRRSEYNTIVSDAQACVSLPVSGERLNIASPVPANLVSVSACSMRTAASLQIWWYPARRRSPQPELAEHSVVQRDSAGVDIGM